MSGINLNEFVAGTKLKSSDMNENFDWLEGNILPMLGGSTTTGVYDLGTSAYQWRTGYFSNSIIVNSYTISGPMDNSTLEVSGGNIRAKSQGTRGTTANSGGTAREISQGTISTPDFRANAVINATSSGSGSEAGGTTITTISINALGNKSIFVMGQVYLRAHPSTGTFILPVDVTISINRDGTAITGGKVREEIFRGNETNGSYYSINLTCIDIPNTAGTYNYNLMYTFTTGYISSVTAYSLNAIEMRV